MPIQNVVQLLVTVWTIAVLLVQMTLPPGFTDAAGKAMVLAMLTLTSELAAPALTTTLPVTGA